MKTALSCRCPPRDGCMTDPIDLTGIWSPTTAALIRSAWETRRDSADPQPIREHYRATTHQGLRAVLANIMTGGER